MAATISRWGFPAFRSVYRVHPQRRFRPPIILTSAFHTNSIYHDEAPQEASEASIPSTTLESLDLDEPDELESLDLDEPGEYDHLSPEEQQELHREFLKSLSPEEQQEYERELEKDESEISATIDRAFLVAEKEVPQPEIKLPPVKTVFWSLWEEEEDKQDIGEGGEYQCDDITTLAHGELDEHREIREYARIAAWEMPLLSKLAKPFTPPSIDSPLRFRYTTYMGESHPAAKKVVLEFCTADLPSLTPAQRLKLIKLVGTRYNPQTDVVKMSSEMFETQAQNKRYLGDLVDTLVAEARGENGKEEGGKDMFEDVPVDFRHVKWKKRIAFPEEWKMTGERKAQLEANRRQRLLGEQERLGMGQVVDGTRIIEAAMRARPAKGESRLSVEAQQGKGKGKGKRKALLR